MPVKFYTCRLIFFKIRSALFKKLHPFIFISLFFTTQFAKAQAFQIVKPHLPIDSLKRVLPLLHDSARIDCLNTLSEAYIGLPDWFNTKPAKAQFHTAEIFTMKALEEAKKINYIYGIAKVLSLKAEIAFEEYNNYPHVEKLSREAISLHKKTINKKGLNRAYWRLGTALHAKSNFDSAISIYDTAYNLSKKAGDSLYIIYSIITCAHVSLEGSNYKKAFEKVLDIHQLTLKNSDSTLKEWELELFGDLYFSFGDSITASKYYDSANKYSKPAPINVVDTSNQRSLRFYLAGIGKDHLFQKKYDKALPILLRSWTYNKRDNDVNQIMYLSLDVAKAYYGIHNIDSSLKYVYEALTIAKQKGARQNIRDAYEILFSVYDHLHKADSAYLYYRQYTTMKDSILNDQIKGKLAAYTFEQKIELLNKEKEISQQQLKIQEQQLKEESLFEKYSNSRRLHHVVRGVFIFRNIMLKRKNEKHQKGIAQNELQLQKLESEKAKVEFQQQATELEMQALRAQMNPHFIFNSLSSINRFILKNESEPASDYLTKFSRLIRMVLTNSKKTFISLEDELEMLRLYLEMERLRFQYSFEYNISFKNEIDPENIFMPPLLLQPFAENAIWHGLMHKQGHGHLDIALSLDQKILTCMITDDGIGREKAALIKSKSSEKQKSMGLQITAERLALLNRDIEAQTFFDIEDVTDDADNTAGIRVILKIHYKTMSEAFA